MNLDAASHAEVPQDTDLALPSITCAVILPFIIVNTALRQSCVSPGYQRHIFEIDGSHASERGLSMPGLRSHSAIYVWSMLIQSAQADEPKPKSVQ